MGYRLNRLDEPVFMAVSKPLLTEFGIHHRLESCVSNLARIFMTDEHVVWYFACHGMLANSHASRANTFQHGGYCCQGK